MMFAVEAALELAALWLDQPNGMIVPCHVNILGDFHFARFNVLKLRFPAD